MEKEEERNGAGDVEFRSPPGNPTELTKNEAAFRDVEVAVVMLLRTDLYRSKGSRSSNIYLPILSNVCVFFFQVFHKRAHRCLGT